jgi:hypothetical protein
MNGSAGRPCRGRCSRIAAGESAGSVAQRERARGARVRAAEQASVGHHDRLGRAHGVLHARRVTHLLGQADGVGAQALLDAQLVRQPLVMDAGRIGRFAMFMP